MTSDKKNKGAPLSRASIKMRVYYEDTDAGGVVYYANYLRFAERARTEWLREQGFVHARLLRDYDLLFVVRRAAVDYRAPARLDDLLLVETELVAVGASKLDMRQIIRQDPKGDGDESAVLLACVDVTLVAVSSKGKVLRLPASLREKLLASDSMTDN